MWSKIIIKTIDWIVRFIMKHIFIMKSKISFYHDTRLVYVEAYCYVLLLADCI